MKTDRELIRIGSRGSPLALWQANTVKDQLVGAHGLDPAQIKICVIKTSGDRIQDRALSEAGGKGLFTKEIEEALLAGDIDIAVHSMKDMLSALPPGLAVTCFLEREDARDAYLSPQYPSLDDLPEGAVIGSSSLRRQAQVKRRRPDLRVVIFRGNIDTRLRKLKAGEVQATFLAAAGLNRLGLGHEITRLMPIDEMLPAVAQGVIGIEQREGDMRIAGLVRALNHRASELSTLIERAFLNELDGSCRTPIAGFAVLENEQLVFKGRVLSPDGSVCHDIARVGPADEAARLGRDAGQEMRIMAQNTLPHLQG